MDSQPEKPKETCSICIRDFANLILHLSKSKCLQEYNEEEYKILVKKSIQKRKAYAKEYRRFNYRDL